VALATALALFLLLLFTGFISLQNSTWWLLLAPLSLFFNGISAILNVWANRTKRSTNLAFNRVIQAIITVAIQIFFGLVYKDERGLMIGFLFGQLMSAALLARRFYFSQSEHHIGSPDFSSFKALARKHRKWVLFFTPTEFINNFINQTPIFLLQTFAGTGYVGNFVFTQRLLGIPQQYLSNGIVDVFKQKASESYINTGSCRHIFIKTLKTLIAVAVVPFTLLMVFAPDIFNLAFGNKWTQAGVFAQYLGFLFLLRFIISPLTYVYYIVGKLKEDFLLHILFLIVTTLSFVVTDMVTDNKDMLILSYSLAYSFIYIVYFIRCYQFSLIKRI
jgi:O-antigen/teichoic acid export membrane protein